MTTRISSSLQGSNLLSLDSGRLEPVALKTVEDQEHDAPLTESKTKTPRISSESITSLGILILLPSRPSSSPFHHNIHSKHHRLLLDGFR
mmetsp:Transcript_28395/g.52391  ORF Transcript_28395/g.52391 Transcript_28395/m.52391 type:complete len:90 (+) Transcript_28395:1-270(+)